MKPTCFLFTLTTCAFLMRSIAAQDFCYKEPDCDQKSDLWGGVCKTGRAQSPINIRHRNGPTQSETIVFNSAYRNGVDTAFIMNNGHTVQVSAAPDATSRMTFITSLFPNDVYVFGQVHCHWKSEHTFDNQYYQLECHFVHYNSRYASISAAVESGTQGALAIFGVLYYAHPVAESSAMKVFTNNLERVIRPTEGQAIPVITRLNVLDMLGPALTLSGSVIEVFQYEGSLTTPQCNEGMHWFVLKHPQYISVRQLALFERLIGHRDILLNNNRRNLQPANGRVPRRVTLKLGAGAGAGATTPVWNRNRKSKYNNGPISFEKSLTSFYNSQSNLFKPFG